MMAALPFGMTMDGVDAAGGGCCTPDATWAAGGVVLAGAGAATVPPPPAAEEFSFFASMDCTEGLEEAVPAQRAARASRP